MLRNILLSVAAACAACSSGGTMGGGDLAMMPMPDLPAAGDLAMSACGMPPKCTDQQIQQLDLKKTVNNGAINNVADGMGWKSTVNATAGGSPPTNSYVYGKFTDTGLMKVALSDEAALASSDWDIAFRRFEIRLNSGVSGPSCVTASHTDTTDYDGTTTLPANLSFDSEAYFDDMCMLVQDNSGLGGPAVVMQDFWTYSMCVQMTHKVYIVKIASGRQLKLTVTAYYASGQDTCDMTGAGGMNGGNVSTRWQFLDK
jgi:hypothetical protein